MDGAVCKNILVYSYVVVWLVFVAMRTLPWLLKTFARLYGSFVSLVRAKSLDAEDRIFVENKMYVIVHVDSWNQTCNFYVYAARMKHFLCLVVITIMSCCYHNYVLLLSQLCLVVITIMFCCYHNYVLLLSKLCTNVTPETDIGKL